MNGDQVAVDVALGALTRGVRGQDVQAVVGLFTEDGVLFGSGEAEHAQGHDAIRAMMTGLFDLPFTVGWTWVPGWTGRDEAMIWFLTVGELVFEADGVEQRRSPYRLSGVLVEADEGYRFAMFNGSEPVD